MTSNKDCRLVKYIKFIDKELFQVFDDLELFYLFNTKNNNITFIYPTSRLYRKRIINLAYSNNSDVVDMLRALILVDYLPTIKEFKRKADDIPNHLGNTLDVDAKSSTDTEIFTSEGLKLELDTEFKIMRNDPFVVYKLSGNGMLSTNTPKTINKYVQGKSREKKGNTNTDITSIVTKVEKLFLKGNRDIYKVILAYIYKLALTENNKQHIVHIYNSLCATEEATFYNLLRPYDDNSYYRSNGIAVIDGLKYIVDSIKKCNFKHFVAKWVTNRDEIIKQGREIQKITEPESDWKTNHEKRQKLLNKCGNINDFKNACKHGKDSELLTIYSHWAINESIYDKTFYNYFTNSLKNNYRDGKLDIKINDTATKMTLYGNLLKSDAFLYIPTLSNENFQEQYKYIDMKNSLPNPTKNDIMFTIEKNNGVVINSEEKENINDWV